MGIFGFILWIALCFAVSSFAKDRNISSTTAFIVALFLSPLVGFIVVALSSKKAPHQWKAYVEAGKKAEYKGEFKEAVNYYKDAMYHLENDYSNLSDKDEEVRNGRLDQIRMKIEELNKNIIS
ncbi:hypothetical protein [Pontibacter actiniarum]|uniref:Uncharacterized protein n=1 Tax=Pontibacter actiniarum TaxID=323450 RepID=A0A1X9YWL4_9BACT|nr:hypothetical protein [Pontibacter actiniarum]ARS37269.1 hypothetical protein CA264_18590 [Pontibacter actiniarum]